MSKPVADPDGAHGPTVRVCAEQCATCVFRPGNLMRLQPGRLADMVRQAVSDGGHIVCHGTLDAGVDGKICAGFYDAHGDKIVWLRLAELLGWIRRV